jgi:aspartate/methionine/tyrosine aminotransferase
MRIEIFEMERWQSVWENRVKFNLSESGVHPMSTRELISDPDFLDQLLDTPLAYNQSNGTEELRKSIAVMYAGAGPDNVEVTNGGSEANFISIYGALQPGDEVIVQLPNYGQIWGLARNLGMAVKGFHLVESRNWAPDLDELESVASSNTRMIVVCNPNNPTGAILTPAEMNSIIRVASRSGAWILADEIYHGSEWDGKATPSFWGKYDRVIITSGLSKAYGLPGLRIGWVVAPADTILSLWSFHDYTTIAPGTLSDMLARVALSAPGRARCLERTRNIGRNNLPLFRAWMESQGGILTWVEPRAGAMAYIRYDLPINSTALTERLLKEKSVLVVPGDHFGMDNFLRLGYGSPAGYLKRALERVQVVLQDLRPKTMHAG